jgi:hypothetical protein
LAAVINCIAALWFIAGLIDWPRAAVLTVGRSAVTSWVHTIQQLPQAWGAPWWHRLAIAAAQF